MGIFIDRLKTIRDRDESEDTVICAEIYHDGSFSITEYDENNKKDTIDVLESGFSVAELDSFLWRNDG